MTTAPTTDWRRDLAASADLPKAALERAADVSEYAAVLTRTIARKNYRTALDTLAVLRNAIDEAERVLGEIAR